MKPTRREFVQAAVGGASLLAAGKETLAFGSDPASQSSRASGESGEWRQVSVSDKSRMRVYVARPEGKTAPVPGVIVLQEIFGVNHYIRDVTRRIAALGYVAAAPDLFHRTAPGFEAAYTEGPRGMAEMQKMTDDGLTADLQATYDLLKNEAQVDGTRIASVGYCLGGRASFLANAVLPLKAAASYYGGGIVPSLLPRAKDQHAAILLFWGGKDSHIPRDKQAAVADALNKAGKVYVNTEFSEAEHGFFCNERESYHPEAARESWQLFTQFFKEHLGA